MNGLIRRPSTCTSPSSLLLHTQKPSLVDNDLHEYPAEASDVGQQLWLRQLTIGNWPTLFGDAFRDASGPFLGLHTDVNSSSNPFYKININQVTAMLASAYRGGDLVTIDSRATAGGIISGCTYLTSVD
ncbi:hypothetical protein HYDPIDRAFT_31114 [Hydnomerulius pinastri MD-312]|uniref:Uncharacterized protein n=1 Tax=Hydnomerulius pinastri MD-312 TaxID=994086 RepID=A0A0C9WCP2_9AGAM|nr:hypothetical protein HYDPIDRAFT_31114 [Hydnomerulius pinastri MD-312]